MDRLARIHTRLRGVLRLTTNVLTPEGTKIVCAWNHYSVPGGEPRECVVVGDNVDEVLRKVELLEEELKESPLD